MLPWLEAPLPRHGKAWWNYHSTALGFASYPKVSHALRCAQNINFLKVSLRFLAEVNFPRAKADFCGTANVLGCTNWGSGQQFPSLRLKVAQGQYQPVSCYVGSRGKGNQSTSSITSSWQITFANIWRQVPHLDWRRQHGLLPQEVRESLGGDRQVRAWEHATVHTHMEAVRNAFSVALSLCWGDKQHMFCKETYHHSWRIFGARNGGLYRYLKSTGPWWRKPTGGSTFRCPNRSINASAGWAYRTKCLKSKQETTAAFGVDGNEDVHFKKDLTAVAAFSSFFISKRIPGTADALSCFGCIATTTTPTINPHNISQPSWHQGLVFQHNKLQILCPLDKGIPHALRFFVAFLMLAVPMLNTFQLKLLAMPLCKKVLRWMHMKLI